MTGAIDNIGGIAGSVWACSLRWSVSSSGGGGGSSSLSNKGGGSFNRRSILEGIFARRRGGSRHDNADPAMRKKKKKGIGYGCNMQCKENLLWMLFEKQNPRKGMFVLY